MLSASLRLSQCGQVASASRSHERRIGSRAVGNSARPFSVSALRNRLYSTATGATKEGTANFFSEERNAQRMKDLKARLEAKRISALNPSGEATSSSSIGELKSPMMKPKVNAKTGWTIGAVGFGTYRLSAQSMEHQAALYVNAYRFKVLLHLNRICY